MPNTYTAIIKDEGDWWIGWIEEIPGVNAREKTKTNSLPASKLFWMRLSSLIVEKLEKLLKITLSRNLF
jgi:hypothetical protein